MSEVHSVAVFCGSAAGSAPAYRAAAEAFGTGLAEAGMRLIYGGGRVGLMGTVADATLAAGGLVVGVIPDFLRRLEVAHEGVAELIVTDSMHTRKRRMFDMADAFAILPGGLGTMDEAMEIITWRQLRLHDKPILFCNVDGSALPLVNAIDAAIAAGFARPEARMLFEVVEGVAACLQRLQALRPVHGGASALL
jgi:uncharacterized protein (TIGR00730 family)